MKENKLFSASKVLLKNVLNPNKMLTIPLCLTLSIMSCTSNVATTTTDNNSGVMSSTNKPDNKPTGNKTLFAIYLLGSDLEDDVLEPKGVADEVTKGDIVTNGAGSDDLREMAEALKNMSPEQRANFDVVVGFGGARKEGWKGIKYTTPDCIIKDSEDNYFGNSDCYSKNTPEANMGDGKTLENFLSYIKETYPASNYKNRTLVLWDHGAAHIGYGPDTNTEKIMSLKEINEALKIDPIKYDMIGFDACLMGNIDVAKFVKDSANYMLASEELEPGHGWQYTEVFNHIANNPDASVVDIGKYMIDSFIDSPSHKETDGRTLSLVNLKEFDNVVNSLKSMTSSLNTNLDTTYPIILKSAENTQVYGKSSKGDSSYSLDLKNFISVLASNNSNVDSAELNSSLDKYILKSRNDGTRKDSYGVAIFDINNKNHIKDGSYNNERAVSTPWFDFVSKYVNKGINDTSSPNVEQISNTENSSENMTTQGLKFSVKANVCDDGSCFKITDNLGLKDILTVKTMQISDSKFMILGSDNAETVSKNVYRSPNWDGKLLMIDGNIIPVDFDQYDNEGNKIYISDAKYNGEDSVISFVVNSSNKIVDNWVVPYDIINGEFRLSREQYQLESKDTLQFYYNVINVETDSEDWELGKIVTIGENNYSFAKPQGNLYTFLVAEDMKGNIQNSPLVSIN